MAAAAGGGAYYYASRGVATKTDAPQTPAKPAFDGNWLTLKLDKVDEVNHNTKLFTFALPEPDNVGGLHVGSALLTRFKGPDMEKALMRPYTPVNDEGTHALFVYPAGTPR